MWNTINLLQFAVFMESWQLSWPNNGKKFMKALKNLALMEFLPKEEVIDFVSDLLNLDDEQTCDECILENG